MVKHNNMLPHIHFHKWWQRYVKTWFDQPGRKKARRLARMKKTAKLGVKPIGLLRPVVRPPTQRYNVKVREGRGFTLDELKSAGISRKVARTIGIAVDHRRRNRCAESLNANTQRLKSYTSKLVVFPRGSKPKGGLAGVPKDSPKIQMRNVKQVAVSAAVPLERPSKRVKSRPITDDMRKFEAYAVLRKARRDAFNVGKHKKDAEAVV